MTRNPKGFTLLELLLAMAIFSLVAAVGYGAYSITMRNFARIDSEGEAMERSTAIFARLSEELTSLVFDDNSEFVGESASYSGGRSDSLVFLGNSPLLLDRQQPRSGQVQIGYQTERDQQSGLLTLYRSESEVLPGGAPGQGPRRRDLLARNLKELRFSYRRQDGSVVSTWQGRGGDEEARKTQNLPWAVMVELVFPPSGPDGQDRRFNLFTLLPEGGGR